MTLGSPFAPIAATLLAVAVVILALLSAWLVLVSPASAQSDDAPTCANGGAVPGPDNNPGLVSDCEALLASRDTLAGTVALNWSADRPITEWEGVTVARRPRRVTELELTNGLTGRIPPELGGLPKLRTLRLWGNELAGDIPSELGNLANLERLELSNNDLTGGIPPELGNLADLERLRLSGNELTGGIPPELGNLANLKRLELSGNELTEEIPSELGQLSNLRALTGIPHIGSPQAQWAIQTR